MALAVVQGRSAFSSYTTWRNAAVAFLRLGFCMSTVLQKHALMVLEGERRGPGMGGVGWWGWGWGVQQLSGRVCCLCAAIRGSFSCLVGVLHGLACEGSHALAAGGCNTFTLLDPCAVEPSGASPSTLTAVLAVVSLLVGDHTALLAVSLGVKGGKGPAALCTQLQY